MRTPGAVTPKFELGRHFCTVHLYLPSFMMLRLLVRNKQTHKQTNRCRCKHPAFFATLRRWVINNKSAQSNLGRGPRRGAFAHIRRKVPIGYNIYFLNYTSVGYNGALQILPPKVPLLVDRSPNPTTCLIPGPVRPMMTNGIRIRSAVFHNALDRPTHRPTDRPRESLIATALATK